MNGRRLAPCFIAHRLGAGLGAENSAAACRAALQAGFRAFECDIKFSSDGQAFALHDDALLRTHGQALRASALPWRRLRELAGGDDSGLASLEQLRELLRTCVEPTWMNLEIKPDDDAGAALQADWGRRLAERAEHLWDGDCEALCLSSFSLPALQGAADAAPRLPRAWLCQRLPGHWRGVVQALRLRAVHLAAEAGNAQAIAPLRGAGLDVRVYTVNDPALMRHWLDLGASGVFTDVVPQAQNP